MSTHSVTSTPRARPLPPDERRAALIAATLPLIREHGRDVSTRQIAEAAGVAEGTIFRVFPDKESLVREAIQSAFDPAPVVAELDAIDRTRPLDDRLGVAVRILQARTASVINLVMTLRMSPPPPEGPDRRRQATVAIEAALVRVIGSDREQLRLPAARVAKLLRLLVFAGTHPMLTEGRPLDAKQIVAVVLDGVREHGGARGC